MLVWVSGATGLVGSTLVERLVAAGDQVVALIRPRSRARAPRAAQVVELELPATGELSRLPRPDVVFHCAAVIDGDEREGRALHVDGTLRLAEAAGDARFVHVSTTDVLPLSSAAPQSESSECAPHDAYGRTKLEGERRLLVARSDAVVLRPPGIYGPRSPRDVVLHSARQMQRGTFYLLGDGRARRSWIFVETLVDALRFAALRRDLTGVYLLDDGRSVSRREIAEQVARALGRSERFVCVPAPLARASAGAIEGLARRFGLRPTLTRESVRYATTSLVLDTRRWQATGFAPRFSLSEAIRQTLDWGRANGHLRP